MRPPGITPEIFGGAKVIVSYGDRTPRIAGFRKEGILGPGFGRTLIGKASKSALRPAFDRPENRF